VSGNTGTLEDATTATTEPHNVSNLAAATKGWTTNFTSFGEGLAANCSVADKPGQEVGDTCVQTFTGTINVKATITKKIYKPVH
jgi:hypothetical protein